MPSLAQLAPVAAVLATAVSADLCAQGSQNIGGNWYCQAVQMIQYDNFGSSGSYNRITNMDSTSGTCSSTPFSYSGSLAPLNDEVSIHMRGPLALKQFAFYSPGSGSSKKSKRHNHRRNAHAHLHAHNKEIREVQEAAEEEKRGLGDWVHVIMDGQAVSWRNDWSGVATPAAPAAAAASTPAAAPAANPVAAIGSVVADVASAAASVVSAPFQPSYSGDWTQAAYYDSASGTSNGISFLNNKGGSGSGVFDYTFGNSLSYAAADGIAGAASSTVLSDTTIPSNQEVIIMSDKPCSGNSCGYSRPGTVAMHGFGGSQKIFVAELSMPYDGTTGFNADMPAWWMLNAQIPRTLQYGKQDCSCWDNGGRCGEFDIMEVLDSGNSRCKSTLHAGISGGSSDFIERPTTPIKVAVVMSDFKTTIKVLDSSFSFPKTLSNDQVADITGDNGSAISGLLASIFTLG